MIIKILYDVIKVRGFLISLLVTWANANVLGLKAQGLIVLRVSKHQFYKSMQHLSDPPAKVVMPFDVDATRRIALWETF